MEISRDKSIAVLVFAFMCNMLSSQTCDSPALICFGNNTNVITMDTLPSGIDATCFTANNSSFLSFSTNNIGGDVNVNISIGNCNTDPGYDNEIEVAIFQASDVCLGPYTELACNAAASGTISVSAFGLLANTEYFVQVDGDLNGLGITNAAQCQFNVNITGNGVELPITLSSDEFIVAGGSVQLIATGGTAYNWSPATGLSNTMIADPIASPLENTEYTVEIINGDCSVFRKVWVFVFQPVTVYDAFTPNGDGINDDWVISRIEAYPQCSVQIFDRWGQLVFKSVGYPVPWKGDRNGNQLTAGNYYYVIELNDDEIETNIYTGRVAIIY